jgi:hypothetical protein
MLTVNDGAADVTSSCMTRVDLPAGETVRLNLGGTGRAVVGRLRPPENFEGRVPWNFALVNLQVDSNSPRYAAPVPGPNPAVQARLTDELTRILSVTATVDRDGRFRIDDMPEGDYLASVYFERRDGNPGSLSNYHIRVPPSDGKAAEPPINLGTIQLK